MACWYITPRPPALPGIYCSDNPPDQNNFPGATILPATDDQIRLACAGQMRVIFGNPCPQPQPGGGGAQPGSGCDGNTPVPVVAQWYANANFTWPTGVPPATWAARMQLPKERNSSNAPANPVTGDCDLSWSSIVGINGQGLHGTYADYVSYWSNELYSAISSPWPTNPNDTSCCGDSNNQPQPQPAPSPTNPPCNFCNQPVNNGTNHADCCLDALKPYLQAIDDILSRLVDLIANDMSDACSITDGCLNKIAAKVAKILKQQETVCEQCCRNVQTGVYASLADADECASCTCQNIENQCSLGQGGYDGMPCQGCGQEPCCCYGGECATCEEEPQQRTYVGWFNCETGETAVTDPEAADYGPPWSSVGQFKEQALALTAAEEALTYCQQPEPPGIPPLWEPGNVASSFSCDIGIYASAGTRGQLLNDFKGVGTTAGGMSIAQAVLRAAEEFRIVSPEISAVSVAVQGAIMNPLMAGTVYGELIAESLGCSGADTTLAITELTSISYLMTTTGVKLDAITSPVYYALNASCRNIHLSPDQAIAAWLADNTGTFDLDTHWAIAGYCPEAVQRYAYAARSKPVPTQINELLNRQLISYATADNMMRGLGYIEQEVREDLLELRNVIPPYSDVVRMMVRDAGDEQLVANFQLDTDFEVKYSEQLKAWANAQGIPDKVMRYLWRSHWQIPSPTQLYEMYHRLRLDPQWGGPQKFLSDVKSALEQQDIAPYWQDKLLAISFNPLTRVDVRRAYQIGALGDDALAQAYRNIGYNDNDVQTLVTFTQKLKGQSAVGDPAIKQWLKLAINGDDVKADMSSRGYTDSQISFAMHRASIGFANSEYARAFKAGEMPKNDLIATLTGIGVRGDDAQKIVDKLGPLVAYHPAVDDYAAGTVTYQDAVKQLTDYGMSLGRANLMLDRVDSRLSISHAKTCELAVRKQFVTGAFSADDARETLQDQGITPDRASELVSWWQCSLAARGKQPSINQLCQWLSHGSITPQNFRDRAIRLGYSSDDAVALLTNCLSRINATIARQAAAQAKAEAAALAKQQAAERRTIAQLERDQRKITAARKARAEAIKRRQAQLASAAIKAAGLGSLDAVAAATLVSNELQYIRSQTGADIDDGLEVLLKSVESWDGVSGDSLRAASEALITAIMAQEPDIELPTDESPFTSNG